jgi:ketoreductase RED2
VNAVAPGLVETPWTSTWTAAHELVEKVTPLHRSAQPDDCASAVVSLVLNPHVTGHVLTVDGGSSLVM